MTCQRQIPFQKWRNMQCMNLGVVIFEFEPCNIYGICYIEPFLFSCLNAKSSSRWTACRTSHTPWSGWPFLLCCLIKNSSSEWTVCCTSHTPWSGWPFLLCFLITNSSSEWIVCCISHTPSSGCPFLLCCLITTVHPSEPYALCRTRLHQAARFFCSASSQIVHWTEPYPWIAHATKIWTVFDASSIANVFTFFDSFHTALFAIMASHTVSRSVSDHSVALAASCSGDGRVGQKMSCNFLL